MNERTNSLLYKNISLTLYSQKGWCWLCVRDELETGQTAILTQQYFYLILAQLLNRGSLRAQSPLSVAGSQFGILSPTDSFSKYLNSQPSLPGMTSFILQSISYLGFIMTFVIAISPAHERRLYPMSVHLNQEPNSSKPNQTEW